MVPRADTDAGAEQVAMGHLRDGMSQLVAIELQ